MPPKIADGRRARGQPPPAGPRRAGAEASAGTSMGALTLTTIEPRPVFEDDTLRDLVELQPQPRDGTDRRLDGRVQRRRRALPRSSRAAHRCAASSACPSKWPRIVELAAQTGHRLPEDPDAGRARGMAAPPRARKIRNTSPISRCRSSSCSGAASTSSSSRARPRRGISVSRCRTTRTRPRRIGGSPISSRSGIVKAALADAARRRTSAPSSTCDRRALHRTRGRGEQGRAARPQGGSRAAAAIAHRRAFRRHRHRCVRQGHMGARPASAGRRTDRARIRGAGSGRSRSREAAAHRSRARVHRFRPSLASHSAASDANVMCYARRRLLESLPAVRPGHQ